MSGLNWNRPRKVPGPLLSAADKKLFKRQAEKLKERVARGHRNPQAYLHGPARTLTAEECAAIVAANPSLTEWPSKSMRKDPTP